MAIENERYVETQPISVVVPILQAAPVLSMFLRSLCDTLPVGHQLILVDDGCSLDSREVITQEHSKLGNRYDLTVLRHSSPKGDGPACNEALNLVKHDITVRLESDAILQKDWLEPMCALFSDPKVAAVAGVLQYPQTGGINHAGLTFYEMVGRHTFLNGKLDSLPINTFSVQCMTFGFTAFRTERFSDVGGFDERYHQGYDDLDLAMKLRRDGGDLLVTPLARAYHWEMSSGLHRETGRKRNLAIFWDRWGKIIDDDLWSYLQHPLENALNDHETSKAALLGIDLHCDRIGANKFWKEAEKHCGMVLSDKIDLAHRAAGDGVIALPLVLGADGFNDPRRFVFLVDNFVRLRGNHYFFKRRSCDSADDLIVDLHGNVVSAQRLHYSAWPGEKIR